MLLRPQIFRGGLSTGLDTQDVAAEVVVWAPDDALTGVAVVEPAAEVVIFGLLPLMAVVELRLLSERLPTLALTPPRKLPPSSTCAQLCTITPLVTVVGEETGFCSIPDCKITRHI